MKHRLRDTTQLPVSRNQLPVWNFWPYRACVSCIYCPEGPNFCPFRSTTHRAQDTTQLPVLRNQLPVWHFQPYGAYEYCIYCPEGPNFRPFHSTMDHFWDTTRLPVSRKQLPVQHFGHIGDMSSVYIAQRAQIFICFALQSTVREIGPNFLFHETNFLFGLMNFLVGIFGFIGYSYAVYIAQRAQIFVCFSLQGTISEISDRQDIGIFQSIDWLLITDGMIQSSPCCTYMIF